MTLVQKIFANDWNADKRVPEVAADPIQLPRVETTAKQPHAGAATKISAVDALAMCMEAGCSGA